MKKFLFILIALVATISASLADNVKTIYMAMPARVRVVQDSTFSYTVKSVDSVYIDSKIKNDTLYFRTTKSDLEKTIIFITTPELDKIRVISSRDYEIEKRN